MKEHFILADDDGKEVFKVSAGIKLSFVDWREIARMKDLYASGERKSLAYAIATALWLARNT